MIWAFGFHTVGARPWTQLDGTVIGSRDIPPARGPRYATEYVLRGPAGQEIRYIAGATDSSLLRSMPVGTALKKQRWQLGYERNGVWVNDFGETFGWTQLEDLATTAAASKIPPLNPWAERIGDLASQAATLGITVKEVSP